MTPEYLAGFFDGEGTFHLGKQIKKSSGKEYPNCKVCVSQSGDVGKQLLENIQKKYGGKLYEHLKAGQHKATKSAYKLYWRKQEAVLLIHVLLPHLFIKQKEAQLALDYLTRHK